MGTPWSGPSAAPDCTAASAARAAARADSPMTVMYAFTLPSMAVMRSRWACTTSTGETFLPAIMRASSVIDVQQSSLTACPRSEDAELRCGLGLDGQVADGREALAAALDQGQERGQLRVGELQSLRLRENAKRVDGELFHVGRIAHYQPTRRTKPMKGGQVLDFPHFTFLSLAEKRAQKRTETYQIASSASRRPVADYLSRKPALALPVLPCVPA